MEIKAEQKFLLISPRKIRPVVELIKRLRPTQAVERLPFVGKKAAEPLAKVIRQAIANAKVKGVSETELFFKEIQVGEGPRLKRGRPISRGQWHPIKKRMSHIRVVLIAKEKPKAKVSGKKVEKEKKGTKNVTKN